MAYINYISEYRQRIESGEIIVGNWIKLAYDYLASLLDSGVVFFNAKKANKAIQFVEEFCHHCEGRTDLLKLELWQKAILSAIFGIVDERGLRVFREIFIVVGRKNGKTLFASAIIAYMAYLDGEYGAKIFCVAPKLKQAMLVYSNFFEMIKKEPELGDLAKKRRSDIYIADTNTSIEPLPFASKKSDGYNPHLVVNDELASWAGDGGLKQYEVMKSALGARRQPLILNISTAGYLNDGIYDELIKRSTAVLKGGSNETRLLPFLYIVDDPAKWNVMSELEKSNPNMRVSVQPDFYCEEIAIALNSHSKKAEFLTKYCNVKQNSSVAWLDYITVANASDDTLTLADFRNTYCVGGIDLSETTDLTAAAVVIERDGKLYSFTQFFMCANRFEVAAADDRIPYDIFRKNGNLTISGENYINHRDVFKWFVSLIDNYNIRPLKIGYDRAMIKNIIDDMKAYGFHMDDVWQGENLTPVIWEFEGILKDGKFIIANNNLLKAHFLNVALKQNLETRRVRPVKIEQRARIDGFVANIDAMTVRQKWYSEIGVLLKNDRKREDNKKNGAV
jgi:phage terminase large subunit-like protein